MNFKTFVITPYPTRIPSAITVMISPDDGKLNTFFKTGCREKIPYYYRITDLMFRIITQIGDIYYNCLIIVI